jgi:phage protein U
MILGIYPFMISTAAYEELSESVSFEWAETKRMGQYPAMHYVGQSARTRQLKGKLCPPFTGGHANIYRLHYLAEQATPLMLISGSGMVLGRWVIETIEDTGKLHTSFAAPRLTEWAVKIKKYDDGVSPLAKALGKASKLISLV